MPGQLSAGSSVENAQTINSNTDCNGEKNWRACGGSYPRAQLVYFTQTAILYVLIIVSLVNLTLNRSHTELWASIISSW